MPPTPRHEVDPSLKVVHCFPIPTDNGGISFTSLSIYREMRKLGYPVSFITPVIRRDAFGLGIQQAIPFIFRFLPWKLLRHLSRYFYHRAVLAAAKPGTVLDLWSDHDPALLRKAKQRGAMIVKEKFNCAQRVAKEILSNEYRRNSLPDRCTITAESIRSEDEQLELADYIFSPSPMVRNSLLQIGIHPDKILDSSFGWSKTTAAALPAQPLVGHCRKPIFLYVGWVEVRKGAHLLLDYWRQADVEGTLVFMGSIRNEMKPIIEKVGRAENIVFLGHHEKAHHIYEEADVFVFPSLEEGCPLVTGEAMSRGLPVLVSPMGAGAIARDGLDGKVISPFDAEAWIHAIRALANDITLREQYSRSATERAMSFQWRNIAQERFSAISVISQSG